MTLATVLLRGRICRRSVLLSWGECLGEPGSPTTPVQQPASSALLEGGWSWASARSRWASVAARRHSTLPAGVSKSIRRHARCRHAFFRHWDISVACRCRFLTACPQPVVDCRLPVSRYLELYITAECLSVWWATRQPSQLSRALLQSRGSR